MGDTTLHIQLADESEMIAYLRWARQKAIELGCKLDEIWFIMAEQYAREHEERESQIRADKKELEELKHERNSSETEKEE